MRKSLLVLALLCATGAQAQLFKCIQDGKVVYQQEKCPETARQSTVRPPDAPPEKLLDPKAAAEKAAQDAGTEVDGLIDVISGFTICGEQVTDFGSRFGPAYEDWRMRNAAAFGRFNSNPAAAAKLDARLRADRAKPFPDDADGRAARTALCARVLAAIQPGRGTK
jgi:hypothetical protein